MTLEPSGPLASALLFGVGLLAGFVNTLAGGGSLLTLPALMLMGLPADVANGTNRLSVFVQSLWATAVFHRAGKVDWARLPRLAAPTLLGSFVGAWAASSLPAKVLEPVLLVGLVVIALLLVFEPSTLSPPEASEHPASHRSAWAMPGLFAIGVYGGFLQAGVGFFLLALFGGVLRYDLVRGNALKVTLVAALTTVALGVFLWHGLVRYGPALALTAGTVAGAHLAVRFALTRGRRTLRTILLVAVTASALAALLR